MKPLEGYTVIDLTTYVAAPTCARLLGEMGARVIKIEPPKGDAWRNTGVWFAPKMFTQQENPIFDVYNSGKDMISLNLKTQEGMQIMHQLLEKADIFITNNRPAALERLGLHYNQLKEMYPRLIYGIVLGFGEKGPDADKPAFDTTAFWSRSGFLRDTAVVGEHEYYPVEAPSGVGDSYTGTNLAMQVLAAVLQRQSSGKGQCVKASLYHVGAFAMASMTIQDQRPHGAQRPRNRWNGRPTVGAFRCADDEWIFLSGVTPQTLCDMCGKPELKDDPMWNSVNADDNKKRWMAMRDMIQTKTLEQWMELLEPLGTPTVRMAHFADVSEDEQAWANGFVERVEYATGGRHVVPSAPFDMEDMQVNATQSTRRIGQDTAKVLCELGYTDAQVEQLAENGVVIR